MWRYEDGGPGRTQLVEGGLDLGPGDRLEVTTRMAPACTMVVGDGRGSVWLLRHTAGDDAIALVEAIDPITLEPLATSAELPGGPTWPGGFGWHDNGSLHVVFGNHAHRLDRDLAVLASRRLPRRRPYNSFVALPGGALVTKDFGGTLPPGVVEAAPVQPCQLVVLEPDGLEIVATLDLPEPSIARLSADGDDVYVVGDHSLFRVRWDADRHHLELDHDFTTRYRVHPGQGYGWDCVIAGGAAWFLDDGDGSERFGGTLRGLGTATAPLHLIRVDLAGARAGGDSRLDMVEVCGLPGGLSPNPPVVDTGRGVVVAYDAANGVLAGFDTATLAPRWTRQQDHASHLLLYQRTGELVTGDQADVVVLDIAEGTELGRADTGSGMQSVVFPAPGSGRDFYLTTLFTVTRVAVVDGAQAED